MVINEAAERRKLAAMSRRYTPPWCGNKKDEAAV